MAAQSKHERRQARMRARIAALEEANMGDKDWFMRGEAKGGARWPYGANARACDNQSSVMNRKNEGVFVSEEVSFLMV